MENDNNKLINPAQSEEFLDQMEQVPVSYATIRMPSGGATSFEIRYGDDDGDPAKEVVGTIVFSHPQNTYYISKVADNTPPNCSSMDGITGFNADDGFTCDCSECPKNVFGSGTNGIGKACKNKRRLYIVHAEKNEPMILTLPVTSLKPFNAYVNKLTRAGLALYQVVTRLTLSKATGNTGAKATYATVNFDMVKPAEKGQFDAVRADVRKRYAQALAAQATGKPDEDADEEYAATVDATGGVGGKPLEDEDLPF